MSEKILIQFKASGDARLRASMIKLAASQALLEKNTKQFRKSLSDLTKGFQTHERRLRNTSGAFSTLRSQMLLFSFAMSLGGRQLVKFAKDAAVMDQMEIAFTSLTGGAENATFAMEKLRVATDGTMSNFDLFQQANNAMVLGITKNSDEMASMFDMAQRLGKALGVDTRRAVESLVTGIGRQSRLMLDNIGIIVKSEEAYEAHAKKLGKNASNLTDSERKQAFLNATLEAARDKLATVGDEQLTASDSLNKFSASMQNLGDRIGEVVLPALASMAEFLSKIADSFNSTKIKSFTVAATALVPIIAALGIKFKILAFSAKAFVKILLIPAVVTAVTFLGNSINSLAQKFGFFKDKQEEATKAVFSLTGAIERQVINTKILTMAELEYTLAAKKAELANANKLALSGAYGDSLNNEIKELENQIITNGLWLKSYESMRAAQEDFDKMYEKTNEAKKAALVEDIKALQILIDNGINIENNTVLLNKLKNELQNLNPVNSVTISQFSALTSAMAQAALAGEHMGRAVENALKRVAAQFAAQSVLFGILKLFGIGIPAPTLFGFNPFGHQGGQVQGYATGGVVPPPGIPSYATGGGVDNVPAMLQEGEYVMRRSAVESIGIENLNRMNRTGQASGGVNINFTGNVLSRDFIEDEAVPLIKNALRKGGDLGLA